MKWTLVAQDGNDGRSLNTAIRECCSGLSLDRLDVAVAYATLQGVKALAMAVDGIPAQSRWVIGLDDAISQPKAIDYLIKTVGSSVRLAKMSPARRFHPKLYSIWSSSSAARCVSAIGSGNMTLNGLRKNGETAVILSAESKSEADELKAQWQKMWALGADATPKALADYQIAYDIAKKYRKKIIETGVAPPEPEPDDPVDQLASYDGNPASAQIAWLEAGSPSAGGRDLEFPKAMMPFFGLQSTKENIKIRVRGGAEFNLKFTERTDNQMWRLLFSSAAIQAAIGRDTMKPAPNVNRSDLIVVFHKIPGSKDLRVELVKIGGSRHIELRAIANSVSGVFRTRNPGGREYGFA